MSNESNEENTIPTDNPNINPVTPALSSSATNWESQYRKQKSVSNKLLGGLVAASVAAAGFGLVALTSVSTAATADDKGHSHFEERAMPPQRGQGMEHEGEGFEGMPPQRGQGMEHEGEGFEGMPPQQPEENN